MTIYEIKYKTRETVPYFLQEKQCGSSGRRYAISALRKWLTADIEYPPRCAHGSVKKSYLNQYGISIR